MKGNLSGMKEFFLLQKRKKKKPLKLKDFLLAERVGFEPTCRFCRQTDFESVPLRPLRYRSRNRKMISAHRSFHFSHTFFIIDEYSRDCQADFYIIYINKKEESTCSPLSKVYFAAIPAISIDRRINSVICSASSGFLDSSARS